MTAVSVTPIVNVRRLLHTNYNCVDVQELADFYIKTFAMKNVMQLGFTMTDAAFRAPDGGLWAGDDAHEVSAEVAMVAPDEQSFALIFETWDGPRPLGPTYGAPFHQGLHRMAMAVDDVHDAWQALVRVGLAVQPPYTFPLPDTKITEGLTILFIRDPNGILVELVERPRSFFVPPAANPSRRGL